MANSRNTMQDDTNEICSVCGKPTGGSLRVLETGSKDGDEAIIVVVGTTDRDFNVCDACNDVVHFRCSKHPNTGYCDRCFEKYDLQDDSSPYGLST